MFIQSHISDLQASSDSYIVPLVFIPYSLVCFSFSDFFNILLLFFFFFRSSLHIILELLDLFLNVLILLLRAFNNLFLSLTIHFISVCSFFFFISVLIVSCALLITCAIISLTSLNVLTLVSLKLFAQGLQNWLVLFYLPCYCFLSFNLMSFYVFHIGFLVYLLFWRQVFVVRQPLGVVLFLLCMSSPNERQYNCE